MDPNVFETANAGFAQVMYEEFLRNPAGVDPAWRELFERGGVSAGNGNGAKSDGRAGAPATAAPRTAELLGRELSWTTAEIVRRRDEYIALTHTDSTQPPG